MTFVLASMVDRLAGLLETQNITRDFSKYLIFRFMSFLQENN